MLLSSAFLFPLFSPVRFKFSLSFFLLPSFDGLQADTQLWICSKKREHVPPSVLCLYEHHGQESTAFLRAGDHRNGIGGQHRDPRANCQWKEIKLLCLGRMTSKAPWLVCQQTKLGMALNNPLLPVTWCWTNPPGSLPRVTQITTRTLHAVGTQLKEEVVGSLVYWLQYLAH